MLIFILLSLHTHLLEHLSGRYSFPRHDPCVLCVNRTDALTAPQHGVRIVIRFEYWILGLRSQWDCGILNVKFALLCFGSWGLNFTFQHPLYPGAKWILSVKSRYFLMHFPYVFSDKFIKRILYLQSIRNFIAHAVFAITTSGVIRHNASRYHFANLEVSFGLVPNTHELQRKSNIHYSSS